MAAGLVVRCVQGVVAGGRAGSYFFGERNFPKPIEILTFFKDRPYQYWPASTHAQYQCTMNNSSEHHI